MMSLRPRISSFRCSIAASTSVFAQLFAVQLKLKFRMYFYSRHFRATSGIFPDGSPHLTKIEEGRAGGASLDSLSVRCLSSYLFFPPV
jgi:hypothetical protein